MTVTEKFKIHEATINDTTIIYQFIQRLAAHEGREEAVVATEESLKKYLFGKQSFAKALIGTINEEPVSFALYHFHFSSFLGLPSIYLGDLYVSPNMRRKSIGKKMITCLVDIAQSHGCNEIIFSALKSNIQALSFYEMIGATNDPMQLIHKIKGDCFNHLVTNHSFIDA